VGLLEPLLVVCEATLHLGDPGEHTTLALLLEQEDQKYLRVATVLLDVVSEELLFWLE
jgi:hypothetical protein